MQVLGHQQQGPGLGEAVDQFAHLAQHPVRADARELPPQAVALLRAAEPRQLQQPGGGHRTQQRRDFVVGAAQPPERFQDGEIRLARAVVLHALATRTGNVAEARDEVFDQHGLADTGLSGNPDHGARAVACGVPGAVQP